MRPWFKKKRFILPLALAALVLLGSLFGGNSEAPTAAVPADPSTTQAAAPTKAAGGEKSAEDVEKKVAEPAAAGINDTVTAGEWEFKVTKFRCGIRSVGDEYVGKKAQGQFCFLNVSATNNGDDEATLNGDNQKLLDAEGKEYSSDYEASIYEDSDSSLFLKGVNPGNTAKGLVVFDIPSKAKPTQASLAGGVFGTKSALVELK